MIPLDSLTIGYFNVRWYLPFSYYRLINVRWYPSFPYNRLINIWRFPSLKIKNFGRIYQIPISCFSIDEIHIQVFVDFMYGKLSFSHHHIHKIILRNIYSTIMNKNAFQQISFEKQKLFPNNMMVCLSKKSKIFEISDSQIWK